MAEQPSLTHRLCVMSLQRFLEIAWARHALARYSSVALVPVVVAFLVPGPWWLFCALGAGVGAIIDQIARHTLTRLVGRLSDFDERVARRAVERHHWSLSAIAAAYVAPYALLAFAPEPGPVIGLMFSAGSALVCASLHVMTRQMILYTIPSSMLGLVANGYALGEGASSILFAVLAGTIGVNAIVMARAGAASFSDLIAARLKAEEIAEDMEARVRERTAQLVVATRRAQEANRAKSAFLASMSHELRTPLNAVIGYAEIVEEDIQSGDVTQSAADLERIRKAASHLLTLINEVLDFSRIEAGKLQLKMTAVPLGELLREAVDTVLPTASKHGTTCRLVLDGDISAVHADETRLRQCVLNLLSNAAKFTHGGSIIVQASPCRVGADAGVAIAVRDTGEGICAETLARLFQPFAQANTAKSRPHEGAGLGLVITRRLARAMGGDVVAKSELGKGSEFTLYLKAASALAESPEAAEREYRQLAS